MSREVVEAPITGKIMSVTVKVGDAVKEEDEICILESMKMENPILAPLDPNSGDYLYDERVRQEIEAYYGLD